MIEFEAKVRQWGNSMGIIIPKDIVKERKLKAGKTMKVMLPPQGDMMEFWGMLGPMTAEERKRGTEDFMKMREENRALERRKDEEFDKWMQERKRNSSSTHGQR